MIARRAAADCEPLQRACPDIAEFHSWYFRCRPGGLDQDGLAACILLGVPGPSTLDRRRFLFQLPQSLSRWLRRTDGSGRSMSTVGPVY
jgi:hypothetical protein